MAFKLLALCHPFIGSNKALQTGDDDGGWDAEPQARRCVPASMEDQAYAGILPSWMTKMTNPTRGLVACRVFWLQHRDCVAFSKQLSGWPRRTHLVAQRWHRALELTKAADHALDCPECGMSYFADDHGSCPLLRQ